MMLKQFGLVTLIVMLAFSCKREGCTDQVAENYDPKAKKNDHSCTYEGNAVLWYGEDAAQSMKLTGVTSLKYYVDNVLEGSGSPDVYFSGAPACGQNGSISVTRGLGGSKGGSFPFRVEDQLGRTIWEGVLNMEAGVCLKQELTF